jgi:hypothetical protein
VTRFGSLARRNGFDVLIVLAALESVAEIAIRRDAADAPTTTLWFALPAIALVVLALLGRRRLPFTAPATLWLLAASLSFVDGRLVPFTFSVTVAGMAAALLLGHLRDDVAARLGLAIVIGGAAIIVYNDPEHAAGEFVFVPALFAIGWLAGFALRERAEQADAAEVRATQAERDPRGTRADRPRAARHRRPLGQRDGAPRGSRQAPATRRARTRPGGAPGG